MPETARKFENGDVCLKADEYVKGQPVFGYYRPTAKGYSLEKTCWTSKEASRYNWVKQNNPNFVPHSKYEASKAEPKVKAKPKAKSKSKRKVA